ncbi:hypothetical protein [Salibacterium lacus]|uniref:Uncharacterized protein n=1 Tax=Salibacterium lacus TaxID=1898109 RepID=A0ABW5T3W8_9BACI
MEKIPGNTRAEVELHLTDGGHELLETEVKAAIEWYDTHFTNKQEGVE